MSTTTSTPGLRNEPVRQIPGEIALQIRRDGLRDLLGAAATRTAPSSRM